MRSKVNSDTTESNSTESETPGDSDLSTPTSEKEMFAETTPNSSWGDDDPPDSEDYSDDTDELPEWKKDPSYSEDSSLFSEDYDDDSGSSFSSDHLHVHPEKDPVERRPEIKPKVPKPPMEKAWNIWREWKKWSEVEVKGDSSGVQGETPLEVKVEKVEGYNPRSVKGWQKKSEVRGNESPFGVKVEEVENENINEDSLGVRVEEVEDENPRPFNMPIFLHGHHFADSEIDYVHHFAKLRIQK